MAPSFLLTPTELESDLNGNLGRANGNIYQRQEGVAGVHDGQVMVRLKKHRYVVLDYSIQPTDEDITALATNPNVDIPKGAGKTKCVTQACTKVGVPVLLYDSHPDEPASLYTRTGLCFECQRKLNEKRRAERKRKSDGPSTPARKGKKKASQITITDEEGAVDDVGKALIDTAKNLPSHIKDLVNKKDTAAYPATMQAASRIVNLLIRWNDEQILAAIKPEDVKAEDDEVAAV